MALVVRAFGLAPPSKIKGHSFMQDFGMHPRAFELVWSE